MRWTRLDLLLVIFPLAVGFVITAERIHVGYGLASQASQVTENIDRIANAVEKYRANTGSWFPPLNEDEPRADSNLVYLNVFDMEAEVFQGLLDEWFYIENNAGLILQLARFHADTAPIVAKHTFDRPFAEGDPYLRLMIGYGDRMPEEDRILSMVRERMPAGSFVRIDDHFYLIDLREVIDEST